MCVELVRYVGVAWTRPPRDHPRVPSRELEDEGGGRGVHCDRRQGVGGGRRGRVAAVGGIPVGVLPVPDRQGRRVVRADRRGAVRRRAGDLAAGAVAGLGVSSRAWGAEWRWPRAAWTSPSCGARWPGWTCRGTPRAGLWFGVDVTPWPRPDPSAADPGDPLQELLVHARDLAGGLRGGVTEAAAAWSRSQLQLDRSEPSSRRSKRCYTNPQITGVRTGEHLGYNRGPAQHGP